MNKIKKLFGLRIKEYRKAKNLTQAKLAELANVDDKHISCIESGKNFPSPELLDRLAKVLNVEPKDFFEFYHHQTSTELKADIMQMLNQLDDEKLVLVYKYIRTFILN
ncbi:helix-turn-helix transcriptional regulator [bacterium]|nr:helix-turn-helix transcriptional regulator [bacterium]